MPSLFVATAQIMKHSAIFLALVCLGLSSSIAQTDDEIARSRFLRFHKRDASQMHLTKQFPMAPAPAERKGTKNDGLQLPENAWFPGEWEEVKAIAVTVMYNYVPTSHATSNSWAADPIVSGYAQYYQYAPSGWVERGGGPYLGIIDTTSSQGKVSFNVIDAIQQGGAEAWVRIEQASDSNIVLRTLNRMGLRSDKIRFIIGTGNSFWYRDCGPICFYYGEQDSVGMVDFEYYPGRALDDSLPSLIESQMGIRNFITTIEWEGGNCLVDGAGMVLSSDAIYGNNTDNVGQLIWDGVNPSSINYTTKARLSKGQVKDSLAHILGARAIYILPAFRYDGGTGHVDLYADMWDENEFVFSIFPQHYQNWTDYATANNNIDSLTNYNSVFGVPYKMSTIPFPCTNNGGYFTSQNSYNNNYTRTYSNHTFVNKLIIQPCFSSVNNGIPSSEWDRQRVDSLHNSYPGYTIYPIDVRSFDGSGGAIHCITKQIPADNPVRILHHTLTRHDGTLHGFNKYMEATVTNRSGIATVACFWRANGGEWHQVDFADNGNNVWGGMVDFSQAGFVNGDSATIEYYISATSNNGKTITKPMTADQGGHYTFDLIYDNTVAGIQPIADQFFGKFYPNPSNGKSAIAIDTKQNYNMKVVDIMGRIIIDRDIPANGNPEVVIDTKSLSNGVYNVLFSATNGEKVLRRLVVK